VGEHFSFASGQSVGIGLNIGAPTRGIAAQGDEALAGAPGGCACAEVVEGGQS
jgi:hypothetical protein